jgi:lipoprotein NlpD
MKIWLKTVLVYSGLSMLLLGCSAHMPAPVSSLNKDYTQIERGSYRGSYYEVRKGDTLYYIAYVTDKDVNELIRYNQLAPPYIIQPGQKLRLWQPVYKAPAYGGTGAGKAGSAVVAHTSSKVASTAASVISLNKSISSKAKRSTSQKSTSGKHPVVKKVDKKSSKEYLASKQNVNSVSDHNKTDTAKATKSSKVSASRSKVDSWLWPTKGRVIRKFSSGDQGNKGIDIAGRRGQSVVSTARGVVVYSGSALRGYGNLVIVKHNDNYLSAYAHNDSLLVREGQSVHAGQKIATMGSSGSNRVKLHFEIRYQGKSVNPQRYLP